MDNKVTIIHSSVDTNTIAGTQTQTVIFEVNGTKKSWSQTTPISDITKGYIETVRVVIQQNHDQGEDDHG